MRVERPPSGRSEGPITELWRLGPSEVIAVVGAGGKSSLIEALARDYEREGLRVVLTTTTKIRPPVQRTFIQADSLDMLARGVSQAVAGPGVSPVVGRGLTRDGKVRGVPPEWVCGLRDLPGVAAVLVESDGSIGRPLKAPAEWEPVVPSCSSLVVSVAGLDAQDAPLDARHVHRPDVLAKLLGVAPDAPIAPQDLLRAAVDGYEPGAPAHAGFIVFLNKVDVYEPAPALVEACAKSGLEVWCGSVGSADGSFSTDDRRLRRLGAGESRPSTIILAAGLARRMGGAKVTAPFGRSTVLGTVVSAARCSGGMRETIVVAGSDYEAVARAVAEAVPVESEPDDGAREAAGARETAGAREMAGARETAGARDATPIRVVRNPAPEEGMSSSLRVGLGASRRPAGVMVLLGDQPLVRAETLRRILETATDMPRSAAVGLAGGGDGQVRPPVLIHRSLLPFVAELRGDEGARHLLAAHSSAVVSVEGAPEEAIDVDRPEDLGRARGFLATGDGAEPDGGIRP
ncbi:MAG: selenium cofactor biosynthesis protein YqeC [Thermoleophilia bacterium]